MKTTNDGKGALPRHLDDADLISFLDGELDRTEQDYARSHLEGCWNCRSQLLAIQNSIENFLRARKQIMPHEIPPSARAVAQFRRRLAQHRSVPVAMHLQVTDWLRSLRHLPFVELILNYRKTALASALTAIALIIFFADPFASNIVSADELLIRASTYELLKETPGEKVIRTTARLDRINLKTREGKALVEIQMAADNLSRAIHLSSQTATGEARKRRLPDRDTRPDTALFADNFTVDTATYFMEQRWLPQVSAALYKRLIAGRGLNEYVGASAKLSGSACEIEHAFAPAHASRIVKTVLTLNAITYAPQSVSIFTVQGDDQFEYRLTRTSIESVERTPEIAKLFEVSENEVDPSAKASIELENPKSKREPLTSESKDSKLETEAWQIWK